MEGSKYKIKYDFKCDHDSEGFSAEEIKKEGLGGCDALFCCSILRQPDGSVSHNFFSADGDHEGEELDSMEKFKVFGSLASNLAEDKGLLEWQRLIAEYTTHSIRKVILTGIFLKDISGEEND